MDWAPVRFIWWLHRFCEAQINLSKSGWSLGIWTFLLSEWDLGTSVLRLTQMLVESPRHCNFSGCLLSGAAGFQTGALVIANYSTPITLTTRALRGQSLLKSHYHISLTDKSFLCHTGWATFVCWKVVLLLSRSFATATKRHIVSLK